MRGFCYIAYVFSRPPDPDHLTVKIGRSIDPAYRFKELRSMAWNGPYKMEVAECNDRGVDAESFMHRALYEYRMHGEWFYLPRTVLEVQKEYLTEKFKTHFFDITPLERVVAA